MALEAYTFSNFQYGIDKGRLSQPPEDGALYDAANAYLTYAHTWKRRPGFRKDANGPYPGALGLVSFGGQLHTFYSGAAPPSTALVKPHKIVAPDGSGSALVKVHYATPLLGYLFVVGEFANGGVWYFYLDDVKIGIWHATTHYVVGRRIGPTVENGLHGQATSVLTGVKWKPGLAAVSGTTNIQPKKANGFVYKCTAITLPAGVTHAYTGTVEPKFPKVIGNSVVEVVTNTKLVTWNAGKHIANGEHMIPSRLTGQGVMLKATYTGSTGKGVNNTGGLEPDWGTPAVGSQIVDGDVTWTVIQVTTITWTCQSVNVSGAAEPVWPTTPGLTVVDGNVTWTMVGRNIADQNCPNTPQAIVLAGKIWGAGAGVNNQGTVYFSAAANPRAWSTAAAFWVATKKYAVGNQIQGEDGSCQKCTDDGTSNDDNEPLWNPIVGGTTTDGTVTWTNVGTAAPQDAGFLNVGLQSSGDTTVTALGAFRGNLAVHTASGFQIWQVDPDPTQNVILDAFEGSGSQFERSSAAVGTDMYYLTNLGIRSLASVASTASMTPGDAGMPIDPLVTALISTADLFTPLSAVVPGAGMYWLAAGSTIFVYTNYPKLDAEGWSYYTLPWNVLYVASLNGVPYVLANDGNVYQYDPTYHKDDTNAGNVIFTMKLFSPYMTIGRHTVFQPEATMGYKKQIVGMGFIAKSTFQLQVGYDESQPANLTAAVTVGPDDRETGIVPVDIMCQSLQWQLQHTADEDQELFGVTTWYDKLPQAVG